MTNVHLLSDLHLDFGMLRDHRAPDGTDVVVLAGDTHPGVLGVMWAAETFAGLPVLSIPGNHEYYGRRALNSHVKKMREKAEGTNVRVLDRETVVVAGTRFVCATLWTDYELHGDRELGMRHALIGPDGSGGMNDYRRICSTMNRDLRPYDLLREHRAAVEFIREELARPFEGPTVVVTHHAPCARSVELSTRADEMSPCYASRLEWLIEEGRPEMWFHGHIHASQDYEVGATRVRANPRGYLDHREPENSSFVPALLVQVERRQEPAPASTR